MFDEQVLGVIASSVFVSIGYLALGWTLTYLAVAARARRPEFPRLLVYVPMIAAILQALATLLSAIATNIAISDFLGGPRTVDAAEDVDHDAASASSRSCSGCRARSGSRWR